ncbi:MAG: hypothetical protein KME40_01590 [Komarekiella atlantica HA4396-MV6]|jgi:predicted small secreted protein|nr:hypothetical protein [Komarekiella atlantica HA4396-MV6]
MSHKDIQEQCQSILKDIQQEIYQLLEEVQNKLQQVELQNLKENIQEEIASQISLLQRFGEYILKVQKSKPKSIAECITLQSKLKSAKVALYFLLMMKQEKIVLAKNIRHDIEYFINSKTFLGLIKNFFKQAVREWSAPTKILLGLAMAMPIYSIVIGVFMITVAVTTLTQIDSLTEALKNSSTVQKSSNVLNEKAKVKPSQIQLFFERSTLVMVAGFAGTFGSIISILIRLKKYQDSDYKGSAAPILVGFAKPLIGTAFGILVFTIINSNIISTIQVPKSSQEPENTDIKYYFFFSIAFVVGFSERLADDIIQRAEGVVIPSETVTKLKEAGENFQNSAQDIQGAGKDFQHSAKDIQEAGEDFQSSAKDIQEAAEDLKHSAANEPTTESSQANSSQSQRTQSD